MNPSLNESEKRPLRGALSAFCGFLVLWSATTPARAQCDPQHLVKLTASDAAMSDRFGHSVSLFGDTALIGAHQDSYAGLTNAGSAYVFVKSGAAWIQQAKLTASDGATSDLFGESVEVSDNTALVGAIFHDLPGRANAGAAYVFTRSDGIWTQQQKLTASDAWTGHYFGQSVAASADTVLIGAAGFGPNGASTANAAYVFVWSGALWTQQAKLTGSDAEVGDQFGLSVALVGDLAVVGAREDDNAGGTDAGSAYVFTRSSGVWTEQAKLTASDAAAGNYFGSSVAVSGDTITVGAEYGDHQFPNGDSGAAYVYVQTGGAWIQQAKLLAPDAAGFDHFGAALALGPNLALVGAHVDSHPSTSAAGSAHIFTRTGEIWAHQAKLIASDAAGYDFFGAENSVWSDTVLIGSQNDGNTGPGAYDGPGSAYIFDLRCDIDGDGVFNSADNCVSTSNSDQYDSDSDGVGDACDDCPNAPNADQSDIDGDNIGDACDDDLDDDGLTNASDVCPTTPVCAPADSSGRPRSDLNFDCNVDGLEVSPLVNCILNGGGACAGIDPDGDGQTADLDTADDIAAYSTDAVAPTTAPCP